MLWFKSPLLHCTREAAKKSKLFMEEIEQRFVLDLMRLMEEEEYHKIIKNTKWYWDLDMEGFYKEAKFKLENGLPLRVPRKPNWERIYKDFEVKEEEEIPNVESLDLSLKVTSGPKPVKLEFKSEAQREAFIKSGYMSTEEEDDEEEKKVETTKSKEEEDSN